jgi:hypothetical protein
LFRCCVSLVMIADLLLCPLLCPLFLPEASCCRPGQVQAAQETSEPAPCQSCCKKKAEHNPARTTDAADSQPLPRPNPYPSDCLCKGAVLDRPCTLEKSYWLIESVSLPAEALPLFVATRPLEVLLGRGCVTPDGRGLRTLYMSYLC